MVVNRLGGATPAGVAPPSGLSPAPPVGGRPPSRRRRGDGAVAALFLAPGFIGFVAFIIIPVAGSLIISFFDWPLYGAPEFVGWDNYARMIGDRTFFTVLLNTLIFAVVYTALNLALALGVAMWLRTSVKGAGFFRVLFFLPVITPMVANALVWQLILTDDGLLNGFLATIGIAGPSWLSDARFALGSVIVMSVWQSFGYNVVVLTAGLGSIPTQILEAARVDGAGAWSRFRNIVLPLLSPALFFASTLTMIGAFQVFAQPQILTEGGPGESTNTFVLYLYRNGFVFDRLGYASALAWVLFIIVIAVTAIQFAGQRKWVNYDS